MIINCTLNLYAAAAALRSSYQGKPGPSRHGFMYEKLDRCHDHAKTPESRQRLRALYSACEVLAQKDAAS